MSILPVFMMFWDTPMQKQLQEEMVLLKARLLKRDQQIEEMRQETTNLREDREKHIRSAGQT
jgi:hypothetical protein